MLWFMVVGYNYIYKHTSIASIYFIGHLFQMDIDATQALPLSDYDDETDDETTEMPNKPVSSTVTLRGALFQILDSLRQGKQSQRFYSVMQNRIFTFAIIFTVTNIG